MITALKEQCTIKWEPDTLKREIHEEFIWGI